jgi:thiamine-monophosphate kinase
MARLLDLGERRIVRELLAPRYSHAESTFGDDCAVVAGGGGALVVTTDPCPPPMAAHLGFDDLYYHGWLAATINLSDLGAAGATPAGLVTSLQLPADLEVERFEQLLRGFDDCSQRQGAPVVGGNLKEAGRVDVTATAFGWCDTPPLTRRGAKPGDRIVAFGEFGLFWAAVLAVERGLIPRDPGEAMLRTVLTPALSLACSAELRQRHLLSAAIDCSDGLWPSMSELGAASGVCVVAELNSWTYSDGVADLAAQLGLDPARLALGWGDWQLVATCHESDLTALEHVARKHGVAFRLLGRCVAGAGVRGETEDRTGELMPLDSQRFTRDSWFTAGLEGYLEQLTSAPLLVP